jgi:hypothetical protein
LLGEAQPHYSTQERRQRGPVETTAHRTHL